MEFRRYFNRAIVLFISITVLFSCKSENESIDAIYFSFKDSIIYAEIMKSGQFMAIDTLGNGRMIITLDSVFITFPKGDIHFALQKKEVSTNGQGSTRLILEKNFQEAEVYLLQQNNTDFECEFYIEDHLIKFEPTVNLVDIK